MNTLQNIFVLIPAYQPTEQLISLIHKLQNASLTQIVIVDDGSTSQAIFKEIKNCIILHHAENQGKGAALKTGFQYLLQQQNCSGVVTVDADGQHTVEDILKVSSALQKNPEAIILGTRTLDSKIPLKSYLGNSITRWLFRLVSGKMLQDTQTGLRAVSCNLLQELTKLSGQRYEYEMRMLLYGIKHNIQIIEVPIQTVYFNNNKNTHFRPIIDSLRIYKTFFNR